MSCALFPNLNVKYLVDWERVVEQGPFKLNRLSHGSILIFTLHSLLNPKSLYASSLAGRKAVLSKATNGLEFNCWSSIVLTLRCSVTAGAVTSNAHTPTYL